MVVLHVFVPLATVLAWPERLFGIIPLVAGLAVAVTAKKQFARLGTNVRTFNKPDMLVTDGLFRYTRNPMYLGFCLALAGIAMLLGSLSVITAWLAFPLLVARWYIRYEENMMARTFGDDYLRYKSKVRAWL